MSIKKYLPILIIILIIASITGGVWFLTKDDDLSDKLSKLNIYSEEELSFLEKEGFFYDIDSENLPDNKEQVVYLFKSPNLIEQNLNSPDEHFEILATKLNKNTGSYQLAFKLENKSDESKEFYLIPISEKDQLEFKEIKGLVNNTNLLSINKNDAKKEPLDELYNVEQHKQELRTELSQAYQDIETNNYKAEPIKIILDANSTIIAQSLWEIVRGRASTDLKPVYFLVYGSAGGAKEELTILNVHSHPGQGENWEVEFTTRGMADLKIIPDDQATIDDDEFTGLFCDDEERFPQILQGDVVYYPNWQCNGTGKVVHYTLTAGNHKLRFEFADQISYAFNATERQSPTGQVTWTNLDGSYLDVDDDPDSPDENWGDVSTNNVDTVAHVSFPTPSGNLTQGANLQEFKVWIKKWNGTGTPQCRIDLYEGGALVTSGTLTNVTSTTGELKSFTWDATALTNADGSGVEAYVFGDAVGGSPTTRASVSVGAVEWNVDYSDNVAPAISSAKDGPDPIEVGQTATFYVDWSDGDSEGVKMYICKADDGTSSGCGVGGTWCENSGDYYLTTPLTCNYTIQSADIGTKDYYAFVCDDEPTCNASGEHGTFTASAVTPISLKFDGGIKFEGNIRIGISRCPGYQANSSWAKIADTVVRDIDNDYSDTVNKDIYCDDVVCLLYTDGVVPSACINNIATDSNLYANILWSKTDVSGTKTWGPASSIAGGDIGGTHSTGLNVGNDPDDVGDKNWLARDYASEAGTYTAMDECKAKGSGWRLPNILELDSIRDQAKGSAPYTRLPNIVSINHYWASTEYSASDACRMYFDYGSASACAKNVGTYVRCVRGQ